MKKNTNITTTSGALNSELSKHSLLFTAIYTFCVCITVCMLVFCYFSVFSSNFYLKSTKGNYIVSVTNLEKFNDCKSGNALKVKAYNNIKDIREGDEVFYAGNLGEGSGKVVNIALYDGYITIECNNQTQNVSVNTIVGKVVGKINFWGHILWFFQSYAGVITFNIILIALIATKIWLGVYYENSKKGRELKSKLKEQKRTYKNIKKMYRKYKDTGLDVDTFDMLDGDYNDNKKYIVEHAESGDYNEAYKFLLTKVHRVYITKQKLSTEDRSKITNCIELMCMAQSFDADVEYMLTDLILRSELIWFDASNFAQSLVEYLKTNQSYENLTSLVQVLYVLIKTQKSARKPEINQALTELENYISLNFGKENDQKLINLVKFIKELIKN